jgi:hypothetical protein
MFKIGDKVRFVRTVSDKCLKGTEGVITSVTYGGACYQIKLDCGYVAGAVTPSMIKHVLPAGIDSHFQGLEATIKALGGIPLTKKVSDFSCCSSPNIIVNTAAGQAFRVCKSCLFDHGDVK